VIAGVLTLPGSANAGDAPKAKIPAMVVVHGGSGVLQNEWEGAKRLNELGLAHLDGSPILMLLGGKDDYTPASFCLD